MKSERHSGGVTGATGPKRSSGNARRGKSPPEMLVGWAAREAEEDLLVG
jgi:hypothetical protein